MKKLVVALLMIGSLSAWANPSENSIKCAFAVSNQFDSGVVCQKEKDSNDIATINFENNPTPENTTVVMETGRLLDDCKDTAIDACVIGLDYYDQISKQ